MTDHPPLFAFDNSYARELDGFYAPWEGAAAPAPKIVRFNAELAEALGLDATALNSTKGAAIFSGAESPGGASPLAMVYAGHQFGGFSPQLGDGRAILVGEILNREGQRRDLHLKGSGRTPFSRGGDGKAVLGPVLREYLMGEAMHRLGVPTTRALAAVLTGEQVEREGKQPGAVLARVASSHLRVGTFQFFAARGETDRVRQLADYAIARHYPELNNADDRYLSLLRVVCDAQAALVAKWMLVGFVHGVMNTDNVTISGETIDYGPCAFIDIYNPKAVFSSIDQHGRYAYGAQPAVAQWNLARFAETLLGLINPDDSDDAIAQAMTVITAFPELYQTKWLAGVRVKLGLMQALPEDLGLANDLCAIMDGQSVDFTQLFRSLSEVVRSNDEPMKALFDDPDVTGPWASRYLVRAAQEDKSAEARAAAMDRVNPVYIPHNHKVEEVLGAASSGDLAPFDRLLDALSAPYTPRPGFESYAEPAPSDFGHYQTFCGT